MTVYAELHAKSAFSFLEGASHPEELVMQSIALGLKAIAITDRNSFAGIVRAHVALREYNKTNPSQQKSPLKLIIGTELNLSDGQNLLALPCDREAYGRLSKLISLGRRRAEKGKCELTPQDVLEAHEGSLFILIAPDQPDQTFTDQLIFWRTQLKSSLYLEITQQYRVTDQRRMTKIAALAREYDIPLLASNNVLMHQQSRRPLADVLTAMHEKCTVTALGKKSLQNAERHLKSPAVMTTLFKDYPEAIAESAKIAKLCNFNLDELRYEYPDEITTNNQTPGEELAKLTKEGLLRRYPDGTPEKIKHLIAHELKIIEELNYAPYFLTVADIVSFARSKEILAQGRGSAANSAVCFALGITEVDPAHMELLFERFISAERDEPPDIDVDFEHERREEVIQHIYEKYGRDRAGLAATVIHFKGRSAIRGVGKAMGLSEDMVALLASQNWGSSPDGVADKELKALGLDPKDKRLSQTISLIRELVGLPRHLSQHVGGFIITRRRLDELVPIENAAMQDRTVIEWDKDDLDALGILKIDVLSLGMLTCLRKCFDLIKQHYRKDYSLWTLPAEDPAVYEMLSKADSIGVFQVESRAQMSFLPRMKPKNFYDLVIEVAIIRPGPIQGDMVHPYIRRRNGEEPVEYASKELEEVLKRTLGVPLFQEQAMKIVMVAAGFTPEEADGLRRAMATFRRTGTIHNFKDKMITGMVERGYDQDFAERCFSQIKGFGDYGFPESHAASFALLVYASAWVKCHYPDIFAAGLLNAQPLGFYAPAQIIRDAKQHGIKVLPIDVNHSGWDNSLEYDAESPSHKLRLGFRQLKGLAREEADWIIAARHNGYQTIHDIWRRAGVSPKLLELLSRGDCFQSLNINRRESLWQIKALKEKPLPLFDYAGEEEYGKEADVHLPKMQLAQEVVADYQSQRLSLKAHPIGVLRGALNNISQCKALKSMPNNSFVELAGLVIIRQRPGTAKGVIFITIEDETSVANLILWPKIYKKFRRTVLTARAIEIRGKVQTDGAVIHVIVSNITDKSNLLDALWDEDFSTALSKNSSKSLPSPNQQPQAHEKQIPRPRHPREQAKILFPSRDFH